MTGSRWERELIDVLGENEWAAMRAPASGSATVRSLPDVLAGKSAERLQWASEALQSAGEVYLADALTRVLAIEAKFRSDSPSYFDREELGKLQAFASNFGANPLVAVRWNGNVFNDTTWYFAPAGSMQVTETKVRLEYFDCVESWLTIDDLNRRPNP